MGLGTGGAGCHHPCSATTPCVVHMKLCQDRGLTPGEKVLWVTHPTDVTPVSL